MLVGAKTSESGNVFWSQITIELRRTFNSCVTITNHTLWVACVQNWRLGENGDVGMQHCLTSLPIYAKLHLKSTLRIFKPNVWLFPITWQFGVHWVLVHIPNIIFYFDFWSRLVKYRNFATFFWICFLSYKRSFIKCGWKATLWDFTHSNVTVSQQLLWIATTPSMQLMQNIKWRSANIDALRHVHRVWFHVWQKLIWFSLNLLKWNSLTIQSLIPCKSYDV